jgi:bacteriorhodopsin
MNWNNKKILEDTTHFSLWAQVIAGLLSIYGIFIKVSKKDQILNHILIIDTFVQFVEFIFYVYLARFLKTLDNNIIASQRYFDWVITTPIMLYATILFMEYENPKNKEEVVTIEKVNKEYGKDIIQILLLNMGMLIFGYLGETHILNKWISVFVGFIFFGLSFYKIWDQFAQTSKISKNLFYFLIIVWTLYGIAAVFPVIPKNSMYNLLDLVSKNFYGLFIFYLLILKTNKNK